MGKHGAAGMGRWLRIYAWAVLAAGAVLCGGFLYPFNDGNMALMAGVGCLIAAPVVYIASFMFPLADEYIGSDSGEGGERFGRRR
ncbi:MULTISPECIES: hypothetical protein [unclassified Paenibacillus]|uniref:hypothetical protein n=1 Tax=unclassified Paenibacillus TaxID=185978 RepID=UPI000954F30F|nr:MULTISPECIES: hypothetical protein [unclassified Paenibacillus]ASS65257.1 hypothetical protein CIC07_03315 [Paenibacillus sp. RUD330]SIQ42466.1 hypothetical protein SAMN05880555_1701 [Paenibacillus sp. RU4X]SIQ64678.1 hypothetical protein SAMN05880570_1699 [Paenibacillus sp. RU4T]